ncbi:hypothetical protein BH11MYX4_BH11MYX4_44020 [soil metagenome]
MNLRPKLRVGALLMLGVLLLAGPHLVWRLQRARTLEVVIVDKTVPFQKYREHAAIPWILHALKMKSASGRFLDAATDYVGYDPKAKVGHDLTAAALAQADVLVVTDTYGVYQGDYLRPGDEAALERSPKIYGGLTADEARVMEAFVARGGLVLAEFNTFASPTPRVVQERVERLFGAHWTRWVSRYWPDLQDANEVPAWVGRVWERVTHTPFSMRGGGLVFVREDEDIVVLLDHEDLTADVVTQERTARGAAFDLPEKGAFWFWMDVVAATDAEVLYEHVVGATAAGAKKLADHGLATRFPALLKRGDAWYFAGDFVDNAFDLGNPERAGALAWRARSAGCGAGGEEAFFWRFYVPIVSRLFASRAK